MRTEYPAQPEILAGKIEEGVGALTGNTKTQIQGKLEIRQAALHRIYTGKPRTPLKRAPPASTTAARATVGKSTMW